MPFSSNRAQDILSLFRLLKEEQLPYSDPGFATPHPIKTQLRQSTATQYANRLRSIQKERFFRKAISASWKKPKPTTPALTPSQQIGH